MPSFLHVIRLLIWRSLARDRLRTLITLLGVALGVAVVLAIRLANDGVLESFKNSLDHVAGKSRLQVSAGEAGFDETLFPSDRRNTRDRQGGPRRAGRHPGSRKTGRGAPGPGRGRLWRWRCPRLPRLHVGARRPASPPHRSRCDPPDRAICRNPGPAARRFDPPLHADRAEDLRRARPPGRRGGGARDGRAARGAGHRRGAAPFR